MNNFKRKKNRHKVNTALNWKYSLISPGPYLRAYIVNDLTVLGVRTVYSTSETQNLSNARSMTLAHGAISVRVTDDGSE